MSDDKLSELERIIFRLLHDYDFSEKEIAESFGISESKIKDIIKSIRRKFELHPNE